MSTICDLFRESFLLFFTLEHKVLTHSWLEQIIDVAVSLAKRADVDRSLGIHDMAISGFQEALNCLESMKLDSSETALEQRVLFFFVFSCFLHQALQPLYLNSIWISLCSASQCWSSFTTNLRIIKVLRLQRHPTCHNFQ